MQKRLALLFIVLFFVLALIPAYYTPDDEASKQSSSLCDIYNQPFTSTCTFRDFNLSHNQGWSGISLSWDIFYRLPQFIPSSRGTRAPPA